MEIHDIIPSGLTLTAKQMGALELFAGGSDIAFSEMIAGMKSGSITDAMVAAREAHEAGRKPKPFGVALLAVQAALDRKYRRAETDLIADGSEAAKVALLKERQKSARDNAKPDPSMGCSRCKALDNFEESISRAYALAQKRQRRRRKPQL